MNSALRRAALAGCVAALALVNAGCEESCTIHRSADCQPVPPAAIDSFVVATTTGEDKSDAEIFFCVELKSRGGEICREMATAADDFERGRTDVFNVPISVDAGDLDGFFIENQGGAFLGNNEWEIIGLTVEANTALGSFVVYDEPGITCGNQVDTGQIYRPMRCSW